MSNVTFVWAGLLPTENTDDSVLDVDDIDHVEISTSANAGVDWTSLGQFPASTTEATQNDISSGAWLVRAVVQHANGNRSAALEKGFNIAAVPPTPKPLQDIVINISG